MPDDNNQSSQGAQEEKVYYDEGNVKITNRRTILDDKTYVLKNISSVTVNTIEHEAEPGGMGCLWVGGGFLALIGLIVAFSGGNVGVALTFFIATGIAFYVAYKFGKGNISLVPTFVTQRVKAQKAWHISCSNCLHYLY